MRIRIAFSKSYEPNQIHPDEKRILASHLLSHQYAYFRWEKPLGGMMEEDTSWPESL